MIDLIKMDAKYLYIGSQLKRSASSDHG